MDNEYLEREKQITNYQRQRRDRESEREKDRDDKYRDTEAELTDREEREIDGKRVS